uniref:Uncharacterized protein n=1 Tax=Anguilla anguilla TaxID=7936 RepID=A0A0E9THN1_ANGAN
MNFIELHNKMSNQITFMLKIDALSTLFKQNISQKDVGWLLNNKTIEYTAENEDKKVFGHSIMPSIKITV